MTLQTWGKIFKKELIKKIAERCVNKISKRYEDCSRISYVNICRSESLISDSKMIA